MLLRPDVDWNGIMFLLLTNIDLALLETISDVVSHFLIQEPTCVPAPDPGSSSLVPEVMPLNIISNPYEYNCSQAAERFMIDFANLVVQRPLGKCNPSL